MTQGIHQALTDHLLRSDHQEDICLITYAISTGATRTTYVLDSVELPRDGERFVHGNATITGEYVLRVATIAARAGRGLAIAHSHPQGRGWQMLSEPDFDAERSYATLAQQVTGLPLVGMTLAGDLAWSARVWPDAEPTWVEAVRRVGTTLDVTWNDTLRLPPKEEKSQIRTVSAWGPARQRDITRLRVLVVGVGSVGLDVTQRLAATGITEIGVMDHDRVYEVNRDRMIGATRRDVRLRRRKVDIAARLARQAATAPDFRVHRHHASVCTPPGHAAALDYDVIISCVDRPWPRAVLNTLAYADLIPVIDGGIAIDTFDDATMRGATRRSQTATPGRPCLSCTGQIDMSEVALEMAGDLDDPTYIRGSGRAPVSGRPNVAVLCAAVSGSQLEHLVSLVAQPGGQGVPQALRFSLAVHALEYLPHDTQPFCPTENAIAVGDHRADLSRADIPWIAEPGSPVSTTRRWFQNQQDRLVTVFLHR
jgi:hypothetical protein